MSYSIPRILALKEKHHGAKVTLSLELSLYTALYITFCKRKYTQKGETTTSSTIRLHLFHFIMTFHYIFALFSISVSSAEETLAQIRNTARDHGRCCVQQTTLAERSACRHADMKAYRNRHKNGKEQTEKR